MMRAWIRWFLIAVLVLDTCVAAVLLTGALPVVRAAEEPVEEASAAAEPGRDALELLGRQLAERAEELTRREAEIDELLRSAEVQRRLQELRDDATSQPDGTSPAEGTDGTQPSTSFAFTQLQRAYENMEPESAALALAELAELDKEAVLQLLAGWKPRTSGQILDALTQTHPALAADLSYRIWKQGGKNGALAASNGR